jgi:hypothetical protein
MQAQGSCARQYVLPAIIILVAVYSELEYQCEAGVGYQSVA